nr:hypothetical protein [Marinactinospora thermotolerans]
MGVEQLPDGHQTTDPVPVQERPVVVGELGGVGRARGGQPPQHVGGARRLDRDLLGKAEVGVEPQVDLDRGAVAGQAGGAHPPHGRDGVAPALPALSRRGGRVGVQQPRHLPHFDRHRGVGLRQALTEVGERIG